jgi:hypothetical protein
MMSRGHAGYASEGAFGGPLVVLRPVPYCFVTIVLGMILSCVGAVHEDMLKVAIRDLRLMGCSRKIFFFIVCGSLAMMSCGKLMMFGSRAMVSSPFMSCLHLILR